MIEVKDNRYIFEFNVPIEEFNHIKESIEKPTVNKQFMNECIDVFSKLRPTNNKKGD